MRDWNLPLSGGCLCGQVRFEISVLPILSLACHCRGCQKLTGSAFSLSVMIPADGFAITSGEPVIGALHKPDARYWFCDWCKGWLYTQPPPEFGIVNVRSTLIDSPGDFAPFVEVWTCERLPWVTTPAVHSFAADPPMDRFQPIVEDFARL